MPDSITCAREGCGVEFTPKNRLQKFHDRACKELDKTQRSRKEAQTPEAKAEAALERKLLSAQAATTAAKRELKGAKAELAEVEEERDAARQQIAVLSEPLRVKPEWLLPRVEKKNEVHRGTLLSMISDLHSGEVVNPAELGGYNKYNLKIAEMRTRRFFARTVRVARNYLAGVRYDGIVLVLGGDLVSGDIHDELIETNECSTLESIYVTVPWMVSGIEMLREEFGKVHVVSVPGNHGRNSKKPRHKKRSENNADTLIAKFTAREFQGDDRVTFDIPESTDVDFAVYGSVFSVEHGDNLRFNGTSEIGSIGPVKRGTLRKTKKRQEQGRPFKTALYGHFHQFVPAYTQGFIMNGSVKGYDEYASDGQFAPEPAQQFLAVVTPEHGITVTAPLFVADRDAEGW